MAGDPTGYAGPHPDIRQLVCDTINQMRQHSRDPSSLPVATLENIVVRCQKSLYGATAWEAGLDGHNYSAAIVQVDDGERVATFFVEATQPEGDQGWMLSGLSGGVRRRETADDIEGVMMFPGGFVCVGAIALTDRAVTLRVEHSDGSVYESPVVDKCAIVAAPEPSPGGAVVVSWLDQHGAVLDSTQYGIGSSGGSATVRQRF